MDDFKNAYEKLETAKDVVSSNTSSEVDKKNAMADLEKAISITLSNYDKDLMGYTSNSHVGWSDSIEDS